MGDRDVLQDLIDQLDADPDHPVDRSSKNSSSRGSKNTVEKQVLDELLSDLEDVSVTATPNNRSSGAQRTSNNSPLRYPAVSSPPRPDFNTKSTNATVDELLLQLDSDTTGEEPNPNPPKRGIDKIEVENLLNEMDPPKPPARSSSLTAPTQSKPSQSKPFQSKPFQSKPSQSKPSQNYSQSRPANTYNTKPTYSSTQTTSSKSLPRDEIDTLISSMDYADPVCFECRQPISRATNLLTVGGKKFHREHFRCHDCHRELGTDPFYEKQGSIYCESCVHRTQPKCGACSRPITDARIKAAGKDFHENCFVCSVCRQPLLDFMEKNGAFYCINHYKEKFLKKCAACQRYIDGNSINALNKYWHNQCFNCAVCMSPIPSGDFYEVKGMPRCQNCAMKSQF